MDFFHNTQEFYSIKELETTGAKKVGVSSMLIKGLLKNLTDNSLVKVEKIGSGNYYWAFTSDSRAMTENKIEGFRDKIRQLEQEIVQVDTNIETSKLERENLVFTSSTYKQNKHRF